MTLQEAPTTTAAADDEAMDSEAICRFFGGTKPISKATLYRGIAKGLIHSPTKILGSSRWWRSKAIADRKAMIESEV